MTKTKGADKLNERDLKKGKAQDLKLLGNVHIKEYVTKGWLLFKRYYRKTTGLQSIYSRA
jgi:hypothetical protein